MFDFFPLAPVVQQYAAVVLIVGSLVALAVGTVRAARAEDAS